MADETKQDDSIIELTDVVENDLDMEQILPGDILSEDEGPDEKPFEFADVHDFNDIEGIDRASAADETPVSGELPVSDEQIAAVLERVIEKKFAEKIEPLLFETMERVILQEIQKIKTTLLKDIDRL
jgi:hypothetical protein